MGAPGGSHGPYGQGYLAGGVAPAVQRKPRPMGGTRSTPGPSSVGGVGGVVRCWGATKELGVECVDVSPAQGLEAGGLWLCRD